MPDSNGVPSSEPKRVDVWVVIAARNEGRTIEHVVHELSQHWSTIVVDDGSLDETANAAAAGGAEVLRHAVNRGQGAALQTGIDFAVARGARVIVTFDADGQHRPEDIPRLLRALDAGADIALGSRFLGSVEGATPGRMRLLRAAVWVSNRLSGLRLTDAHCGLRAFPSELAPKLALSQDRMAHASELLANVRRHRLRWVEVPVTIVYTPYSLGKGQRGLDAIRILFEYLSGITRAR